MERETVLSSHNVKDSNNRASNFVTHFNPPLIFDKNHEYMIGLNRIITMSFIWTNINAGNNNQLIKFSKYGGSTFTNNWNYDDISRYIGQKTVFKDGKDVYPVTLDFDEPTFRVVIRLKENYQIDLTHSNFYDLIGFDEVITKDPVNIGARMPNLAQNVEIRNIHCDLVNDSLVDGFQSDIIHSFGTGDLRQSYSFTKEPRRTTYNPVKKIQLVVSESMLQMVNEGLLILTMPIQHFLLF